VNNVPWAGMPFQKSTTAQEALVNAQMKKQMRFFWILRMTPTIARIVNIQVNAVITH